jgi:MHS family proline/betaine transporter-like MFS transporter
LIFLCIISIQFIKHVLTVNKKTKVLVSSVIGNGLEFYDFTLFGAFAIKFSTLFSSPESSEVYKGLMSLLIFGIGFFARPLGALFFGSMGDRWGRKNALSLSIILMGISTLMIGCLPTYASWGLAAPIALTLIRCLQGFCLGGENNGSAIFFLEHLKERKGLAGALILTGGAVGTLLAYAFSAITSLEGMPEYAWRIPFIVGLLIGLLGLYIRKSLPETDEFLASSHLPHRQHQLVLTTVWREYRRPFLCTIGIGGVNVALAYTTTTYLHFYMAKVVHLNIINALMCTCVAITLFGGFFAPLMGHLSDKFSAHRVMYVGCLATSFLAFPLFWMLSSGTPLGIAMGIVTTSFLMGAFNGPTNAYLNTLFPPQVRYTAIAFGYAIGAAVFGGLASYYYQWLIVLTHNNLAPALYMIFMGALGALSLRCSQKASESPLSGLAKAS